MQNRSPITSCLYFTSNKNIDSKDSDDFFYTLLVVPRMIFWPHKILTWALNLLFFSKIFNAALIGTIRVFGGYINLKATNFFLYHFVGFWSLSNNNSQLYYIFLKITQQGLNFLKWGYNLDVNQLISCQIHVWTVKS